MSVLGEFLEAEAAAGSFPAGQALVADGDGVRELAAVGCGSETLFDLASLTKVLCTAPLARLAEREGLDWRRPAGDYLDAFRATRLAGIRLWHLAAHVSGLPAWQPLYASGCGAEAYRRALARIEPEAAPGERVVYSDIGMLVLGEVLEKVLGAPLDEAFRSEVAEPARSGAAFGPIRPPERAAPTERGNAYERRRCEEMGIRFEAFRTGLIQGEVHDANAHFLGGVAPHAGLFATAEDVARLARPWLESPGAYAEDWTPALPESRGLFWQRARGAGSAIPAFPDSAIGHTGFTGTSVWIDPEARRLYVLLTNRVHPEVRDVNFHEVRRRFHEAAIGI